MSIVAQRIRTRLKVLGLSPRAASLAAGRQPFTVRDILSGKNENPKSDLILDLARAMGLRVIAYTRSARKADFLKKLGASEVVVAQDDAAGAVRKLAPRGCDGAVECSGNLAMMRLCVDVLRRGGTFVPVASEGKPAPMPITVADCTRLELTIRGARASTVAVPGARRFHRDAGRARSRAPPRRAQRRDEHGLCRAPARGTRPARGGARARAAQCQSAAAAGCAGDLDHCAGRSGVSAICEEGRFVKEIEREILWGIYGGDCGGD